MEVINFREIEKGGALKAAFTALIPEWGNQETDAKFFENDKGQTWVSFANSEFVDNAGQKKYYSLTRWPKDVTAKLSDVIIKKIKAKDVTYKIAKSSELQTKNQWDVLDEQIPF